jgi:putative addiction module component (TIGR02574 family)
MQRYLEHEAQILSKQERAFLADRLLSALDGDVLDDVEEVWIAEAEHRYKEYKEGKRPGSTAEEVFAEVDRVFK